VADSAVPPAVFTETATARVPTTVTAVSGGNQSALTGKFFDRPLVVHVEDQTGRPMAGVEVTFALNGPASFATGPTSGSATNADGNATAAALPAGSSSGDVHVSEQVGDLNRSDLFTETVVGRVPC
jgi:hypothetical protein